MARDWAVILKPYIDARRLATKSLRDQVWRELSRLREALNNI